MTSSLCMNAKTNFGFLLVCFLPYISSSRVAYHICGTGRVCFRTQRIWQRNLFRHHPAPCRQLLPIAFPLDGSSRPLIAGSIGKFRGFPINLIGHSDRLNGGSRRTSAELWESVTMSASGLSTLQRNLPDTARHLICATSLSLLAEL